MLSIDKKTMGAGQALEPRETKPDHAPYLGRLLSALAVGRLARAVSPVRRGSFWLAAIPGIAQVEVPGGEGGDTALAVLVGGAPDATLGAVYDRFVSAFDLGWVLRLDDALVFMIPNMRLVVPFVRYDSAKDAAEKLHAVVTEAGAPVSWATPLAEVTVEAISSCAPIAPQALLFVPAQGREPFARPLSWAELAYRDSLLPVPALTRDPLARLMSRVERAYQDGLLRSDPAVGVPWPLFARGDPLRAFLVQGPPQLLGRLMPPVEGPPDQVLRFLGSSHFGCSRIQLRAELADWGPAYASAEPIMRTAIGARVVELASELLRDADLATIPPVAVQGAEWPAPFTAENLYGCAAFIQFCELGPGVGQRFINASLAGEAADAARRAEDARAREPASRGVSAPPDAPA